MEKITRFERARAVSARSLQLALGAPALVKAVFGRPYDVAKQEFEEGKIPFVILRKYPNGRIVRIDFV